MKALDPPVIAVAYALEAELRARHPDYGAPGGFDGYGKGADRYVCTRYSIEVLSRAGYPVDAVMRDRINIEAFRAPLAEAVARGDVEISGVVYALTAVGLGDAVAPDRIAPGDFMQYWYTTAAGGLAGHVGLVVARAQGPEGAPGVRLHGAHRTTRGVAVHPEVIRLDNKRALFAVRPRPLPAVRSLEQRPQR